MLYIITVTHSLQVVLKHMPGMRAVICQNGDDITVASLAKQDPTFGGTAGMFFIIATCVVCDDQVPPLTSLYSGHSQCNSFAGANGEHRLGCIH